MRKRKQNYGNIDFSRETFVQRRPKAPPKQISAYVTALLNHHLRFS